MYILKCQSKPLCSWVDPLLSFLGDFPGLTRIIHSTNIGATTPREPRDEMHPNTVNPFIKHYCLWYSEEISARNFCRKTAVTNSVTMRMVSYEDENTYMFTWSFFPQYFPFVLKDTSRRFFP